MDGCVQGGGGGGEGGEGCAYGCKNTRVCDKHTHTHTGSIHKHPCLLTNLQEGEGGGRKGIHLSKSVKFTPRQQFQQLQ